MLQLIALIVCSILGSGWAQTDGEWTVQSYPDPIANPAACGRPNPSFVCDPNSILPELEVELIDELAKNVYNETNVACSYDEQGLKRRGYLIMVAAMPKMVRTYTVNHTDSRQTRYLEAQYFSYVLGTYKWTYPTCNATTIILYSAEDGVLYTSTQPTARAKLTDDIVTDAALDVVIRFYPINSKGKKAASAIKYLVQRYSHILLAPQ